MRELSKEEIAYIKKHHIPGDKVYGVKPLARRFDVTVGRINCILDGREWSKRAACERCGKELTRWQRKWCADCAVLTYRVSNEPIQRHSRRDAHNEEAGLAWEADICLNCKRTKCNNCLFGKSVEEKKEMLRKCGGKKWLD